MDNFDDFDALDAPQPSTRGSADVIWNILTVVVLLTTLCIGTFFLMVFINPYSGLNPFPPPTLPPTIEFPTPTNTPKQLPPTWTPTPVPPTATWTPVPTDTPTPTASPTPEAAVIVTDTPTPEQTTPPFALQPGNPVAIPAGVGGHPDCDWMGVAGQVIDLRGAPLTNQLIKVTGTLEGQTIEVIAITGLATQYGPAGYEITLANKPIASTGTLTVQMFDQAGLPLSEPVVIDTYDTCDKNLILVNFVQIRE